MKTACKANYAVNVKIKTPYLWNSETPEWGAKEA